MPPTISRRSSESDFYGIANAQHWLSHEIQACRFRHVCCYRCLNGLVEWIGGWLTPRTWSHTTCADSISVGTAARATRRPSPINLNLTKEYNAVGSSFCRLPPALRRQASLEQLTELNSACTPGPRRALRACSYWMRFGRRTASLQTVATVLLDHRKTRPTSNM